MNRTFLNITDNTFFKIALSFSVCLLFFIASVSFRQLSDVTHAQELIIRSRDRQIELEKLLSVIKDAERMQRGYLLTGEQSYLEDYYNSRHKTEKILGCLETLVNNESLKRDNLASLKTHITKRLDILDQTLTLSKTFPVVHPELTADLKKGGIEMQKIQGLINKIVKTEKAALHHYEAFHKSKNKFLPYTTGFLVIFALLILFVSFYKINRDSEKFRKMNDDLVLVNKSFQYAEEIAAMGHWKRNLKTFEIEWSDNMLRLLGVQRTAAMYNEETLVRVTHPDDRQKVAEAMLRVRDFNEPPNIIYRIIKPNGQIRFLKSAGKLIHINGTPLMLGATCDVTEQVENSRYIEKKNLELEAAIEELASFNHIASHDLQEPLRKIQMFISRIAYEEADKLSQKGQEYFERVNVSALRMEQLIDDLLLYAETNKAEQVFETSDLNGLLLEAQQELKAEIEEKQAVITSEMLPNIPVIPFQIRQLFVNLLANALKYSLPGTVPQIKITCQMVRAKDIEAIKSPVSKNYFQISITDNGIGFKQEFAEKIFVLFQRLHKKDDYSGTGIGLAICRKIAENHFGFMTATGAPGQGASFHIYLPK